MRLVCCTLLLAVLAPCALAAPNAFQQPCASHIQSAWPEALRKAAQADCDFAEAARKKGAAPWADYAAPDASMAGLSGREAIRARFEKAYARPGFQLFWYPTGGSAYGPFVVTTGNYEHHSLDKDGKDAVVHGNYVTVWQKQKDGSYLYVWDGGE